MCHIYAFNIRWHSIFLVHFQPKKVNPDLISTWLSSWLYLDQDYPDTEIVFVKYKTDLNVFPQTTSEESLRHISSKCCTSINTSISPKHSRQPKPLPRSILGTETHMIHDCWWSLFFIHQPSFSWWSGIELICMRDTMLTRNTLGLKFVDNILSGYKTQEVTRCKWGLNCQEHKISKNIKQFSEVILNLHKQSTMNSSTNSIQKVL